MDTICPESIHRALLIHRKAFGHLGILRFTAPTAGSPPLLDEIEVDPPLLKLGFNQYIVQDLDFDISQLALDNGATVTGFDSYPDPNTLVVSFTGSPANITYTRNTSLACGQKICGLTGVAAVNFSSAIP